jgi:hypothetical protein
MERFDQTLHEHFPNAMPLQAYMDAVREALAPLGFDPANAIACAAVCRDEITQPFVEALQRTWGEAFNLSSLAGMVLCGKTGFHAALAHAPIVGGRRRVLVFGMAHIGLGADGTLGTFVRRGFNTPSSACGALAAFRRELAEGHLHVTTDPDDIEQSLLRQRLLQRIPYGRIPSLLELALEVEALILADVERQAELGFDPSQVDWGVLNGMQVHGPGREFVRPGRSYAVTSAGRVDLPFDA